MPKAIVLRLHKAVRRYLTGTRQECRGSIQHRKAQTENTMSDSSRYLVVARHTVLYLDPQPTALLLFGDSTVWETTPAYLASVIDL